MNRFNVNQDVFNRMLPAIREFLKTYNIGITVALSLATLTVIIMLAFNITKFVKAASNPNDRNLAKQGIFVCAVGLVILGSIDIVYATLLSMIYGTF